MKILTLTSTVLSLTTAGVIAQQSDVEYLRSRADSHERKIIHLENELNQLKANYTQKQKSSRAVPVSAALPEISSNYVVKRGDVLVRIAKQFKTSVAAIKSANGLTSDNIQIGQKLRIPAAHQSPEGRQASQGAATAPVRSKQVTNRASSHTVKSGETFHAIAQQHRVSVASLKAANPGVAPTRLQVGKVLKIDATARASAPRKAPKAATAAARNKATSQQSPKAAANSRSSKPASSSKQPEIKTITVQRQISYGQFASQHGANTSQLNELNGLSLSKNTMLAVGSELYVPRD